MSPQLEAAKLFQESRGVSNMGIAERIYELVKGLPDEAATEVLEYAQAKCAGKTANVSRAARRKAALAVIEKHAGRFKVVKFSRTDLYDRAGLR
jgi:hypothetical protein